MDDDNITPEKVATAEANLKVAIYHIETEEESGDERPTVKVEDIDIILAELAIMRYRMAQIFRFCT